MGRAAAVRWRPRVALVAALLAASCRPYHSMEAATDTESDTESLAAMEASDTSSSTESGPVAGGTAGADPALAGGTFRPGQERCLYETPWGRKRASGVGGPVARECTCRPLCAPPAGTYLSPRLMARVSFRRHQAQIFARDHDGDGENGVGVRRTPRPVRIAARRPAVKPPPLWFCPRCSLGDSLGECECGVQVFRQAVPLRIRFDGWARRSRHPCLRQPRDMSVVQDSRRVVVVCEGAPCLLLRVPPPE